MFRGRDRDLLFFVSDGRGVSLSGATYLFMSPTAHFSQQLEKWAKEPEETKGFFTSLRAMPWEKMRVPATRSRKSSFFVPSKDYLSNSAAAADWFDEQRFSFYRRSA